MYQFFLYPVKFVISTIENIGRYVELMFRMFSSFFSWYKYLSLSLEHMYQIGFLSIPIVIMTSLFSGMVTSVQAAYQFESSLVPNWYVGGIVGESIILELAPMLTGLVMTGKIGATIAAEIGTMRVTEQIDALESLSFDPILYLIMPRVIAAIIMFPVMVIIADLFGILGGYFAALSAIDVTTAEFLRGLRAWFRPWDAWFGIVKGICFGISITSIACFHGYYTSGGANGVGKSTTSAVVNSCVAIFILDYVLAALLL
tara:strand:+ start:1226 stop:1999 length:774 start_codon:yes stop_codon:yes gene_type:complete